MSCAMSQVKDTRPSILASNVSDVTLMSLMCCDHLTEVFASHRNSWHRGNGGNWGLASSPLSLRHPASMHPLIHRALMARIVRASVLQTVHCGTTSHAYGKKMQRLDVELSAMRQRTM